MRVTKRMSVMLGLSAALGVVVALAAVGTPAARPPAGAAVGTPGARAAADRDQAVGNVPYDGRLIFARLRYHLRFRDGGKRDFRYRQDLPWAHDYPTAEVNLMKILETVTFVRPHLGEYGGNVFELDDPDLHKFPIGYMSEPGYWTMTDEEAASLRSYLLKGGFLIFDDFRLDHWYNFEAQFRRVLPEHRFVELDGTHPIFHSFFEIPEPLEFIPEYDQDLQPLFYGVFEDNDPRRRLMVIANYNNDIGEYWEYSNTGFIPIDLSNEAFKFGVNYIVYGLTH
jgi:hypothetical protein